LHQVLLDSGTLKRLNRFVQGQGRINAMQSRSSTCEGVNCLPDLSREVSRDDGRTSGQHYSSFNGILQFAYIAWPAIGLQHVHRLLSDTQPGTVHLTTVMRDEMVHESGDVGTPFMESRDRERHHIEPVVEILTKSATLHSLVQVAIGGSQNTHINTDVLDTANALELSVL